MPNNRIYPQDKIIKSRVWKWITIIATLLGLITGIVAIYTSVTREKFTVEQMVDPETMHRLKELGPGESIPVMKGRPADESGSPSN